MIELHDGMLLYHGSYIGIPEIDLDRCFGGLDFGRGFYLTSSYEQAYHYVQLSVRKAIRIGSVPEDFDPNDGHISVYKFHYDPNILAYCFQGASVEWLHFVAANRKKDLFPQLLKKYSTIDIIGGKIADDQTARTLQRYISGADFGVPGTPEADRDTIKKLLPNRLQDQFCFRTQDAIDHLEFIRSDRYGDIKLYFTDSQKESCAVTAMRDAVISLSTRKGIPYEEALLRFTSSRVYNALFDYSTEIWKESSDYLLSLYDYCNSNKSA